MDWLRIVNKAEREIEITIEGIIGGTFFEEGITMEKVNRDLKSLKAVDADTITVNMVNVPGGSVLHGLGIIDILSNLGAKIIMKGVGMVASMGAEILMTAKTEDREITKNSFILFHRLTGQLGGQITEVENAVVFMKKNEKKLIDLVVEATDLSQKEVETLMDRDGGQGEFLTAQEALDMGLIGKITEPSNVALAAFTEKTIPNSGLPELPAGLVMTAEADNINSDSLVNKIFGKLKGLLDTREITFDEDKLKNLITVEVITMKEEYEAKLTDLNTVEIENNTLKEDNKRLKAEVQTHADQTNNDNSSDPAPAPNTVATGLGAELIKNASPSMKRALNKSAELRSEAEANNE